MKANELVYLITPLMMLREVPRTIEDLLYSLVSWRYNLLPVIWPFLQKGANQQAVIGSLAKSTAAA